MTRSLFCPECLAPLRYGPAAEQRCPSCGTAIPVREGIPLLGAAADYYYDEIPVESMEWFLSSARTGDFARPFEREERPGPWGFILGSHFDVTRGSWKLVTTLPQGGYDRVLDLGSGWGVNAIALAPHAREVVALDPSWHRCVNLRLLADARNLTNVTVLAGGDRPRLPFPDKHFDLVVLVGVIEWVAVGRHGTPRHHQEAFLREVRRITRPTGEVFLASENRYAYSYWTGRPDDHTGLLFGSLLPRPIANLYSRLRRGVPYQNYTYSNAQYARLMSNAGFPCSEAHGILPAHRTFVKIFPLARGRVVDRDESRDSKIKNALLRTRFAAKLASAIGVRASGASLPPSFLRRLCTHLNQRAELGPLEPEPFRLTTTNFAVKAAVRGMSGAGGILIRIPLTGRKRSLVRNAAREQRRWQEHARIGHLVPRVLAEMEFEGQTVTCEELLSVPTSGDLSAHAVQDAADVLTAFATERGTQSLRQYLEEQVGEFVSAAGPQHGEILDTLRRFAEAEELTTCYGHGDFHRGNLAMQRDRLHAIVDWEWATPDGLPFADVLHLLTHYGDLAMSPQILAHAEALLEDTFPFPQLLPLITTLLHAHDLRWEDLRVFVVAYLYDRLAKHWIASESYGLGRRFLVARQLRLLDRLPAFAEKAL